MSVTKTKSDLLYETLSTVGNSIEGIIGIAVASNDGLPIANAFKEDFNIDLVCAMATSLEATSRKIGVNMGLHNHRCTIVDNEDGLLILYGSTDVALLALLEPNANIGLARLQMKDALTSIERILND